MNNVYMKIFLIVILLAAFSSSAMSQRDYIVGLKNEMPRRGKVQKEFAFIRAYHTKLTNAEAEDLRKDSRVQYVEANLQNNSRASVAQVEAAILTNATQNALTNIGAGSPNALLYSFVF